MQEGGRKREGLKKIQYGEVVTTWQCQEEPEPEEQMDERYPPLTG
jgi:hypothetical protein